MALELGEATWKLGFTVGLGQSPRERDIRGRDVEALKREIQAAKERFELPEGTPVVSCYEAGREGFWLHRCLLSLGVKNEVVDSSSIEVPRRKRRAKTDRLDVKKLLRMLVRWQEGEREVWRTVRAPTVEEEDARQLHRELETLKKEQTSHVNRIKGLLASCGLTVVVDRQFPKRLKELRQWDGSCVPAEMRERLLREFRRMQVANRQIRDLEKKRARQIRCGDADPAIGQVRKLLGLKAIGTNSAWLYVQEMFAWRKIQNRRQVGGLLGLVGSPYRSGEVDHDQGISKAGNRRMRAMSIEIAWGWVRWQAQSALSLWFQRRFGHGSKRQRRIGIVALARRLVVALWKYLETGIPPDGAELVDWRRKTAEFTPRLS
jgi:transposase